MRRREFVGLLAGAMAAHPLAARAQTSAMPVIGYLSGRSPDAEAPLRGPFLTTLEEHGFAVGRNVDIVYRFTEGQDERLPALAADLLRQQVTMLIATSWQAAMAAKAATAKVPIVFASGLDPARLDLVASFNRPGGNATGMFVLTSELGPKRFELLRELLPEGGMIAFVGNANSAGTPVQSQEIQAVAQAVGQSLLVVNVGTVQDVDKAFSAMAERNVAAIIYGTGLFFQVVREQLVALSVRYRIPAIYEWREFVTAGGLMSYSADRSEVGRLVGAYAGRVLKGEKPADLPVVESSKFELVINLRTARTLGLAVPQSLLARADEVIE